MDNGHFVRAIVLHTGHTPANHMASSAAFSSASECILHTLANSVSTMIILWLLNIKFGYKRNDVVAKLAINYSFRNP